MKHFFSTNLTSKLCFASSAEVLYTGLNFLISERSLFSSVIFSNLTFVPIMPISCLCAYNQGYKIFILHFMLLISSFFRFAYQLFGCHMTKFGLLLGGQTLYHSVHPPSFLPLCLGGGGLNFQRNFKKGGA